MRQIFVALHGQNDNIGDSILRRAMLGTFDMPDVRRHVLVGHHGGDYQSALALRADDVVYATRKDWQVAAFRAALRSRIAWVSNAGEIQMNSRRIRITLVDLALVVLVRLRGGVALQTGMGLRRTSGGRPTPIDLLARACDLKTWRDRPSRDYVGVGEVLPDWAFLEGGPVAELENDLERRRTLLAVTMRGDRPLPPPHWIEAVRSAAAAMDLQIVVTTQVARDSARSLELAELLAGTAHQWEGGDHHEQERYVRSIYRQSAAVVSDRLHALVLGLTEGAAPIGYTVGSPEKVARTFEGAGFEGIGFSQIESTSDEAAQRMIGLAGDRRSLLATLEQSRVALRILQRRMRDLVGGL